MTKNPLVEQAKQGNVNAIASLMNRLLKSQAMLANVERDGDRLEILIESDLRSLDDEVRIPNRQVLVGMIKKWFITLEIQTVSRITVSWQQAGFEEPAWTEEIYLVDQEDLHIKENGGITEPQQSPRIPPLPVFPPKSMLERNDLSDRDNSDKNLANSSLDLDEMFGEVSPESLPNINSANPINSNLENMRSPQDSELLFLSDLAAPESTDISNFQPEPTSTVNKSPLQTLLQTPNFAIQMAQYVAVCVIIIVTLRGIHAVFGTSKTPKAASISSQLILI
jgi:hypothetical protein